MLDIIFLIDVSLSCVTTYVDEGRVVFDMRMIFWNYAKNWMVLDLLGSFPIDKVKRRSRHHLRHRPFICLNRAAVFVYTMRNPMIARLGLHPFLWSKVEWY